jgi:hypothetical protein
VYANDYTLELSCEVAAPRSGQSLRRLECANRFAAVGANHPVSRPVVIAAPGKLRLHRHGQISPILVIETLSAARIGRIVWVPIVGGVRGIVRVVSGGRGVPGVPPWEAKRNEIKSEEETIMVNEAVIKESIVVNETVPV